MYLYVNTTRKKIVTLDKEYVSFSSDSSLSHIRIHVNYHVYAQKTAILCIVCTESVYWCIFIYIYDLEENESFDKDYMTFFFESLLSHIPTDVTYHVYAHKTAILCIVCTESVYWCIFMYVHNSEEIVSLDKNYVICVSLDKDYEIFSIRITRYF